MPHPNTEAMTTPATHAEVRADALSEIDELKCTLKQTLLCLEYFYQKHCPEWDGVAAKGSTIDDARVAVGIPVKRTTP
jgi:hypothetical protein